MKNKIIKKIAQIWDRILTSTKTQHEAPNTELHNAEIEMLRQRVLNAEMAQVLFVAGRLAQI